MSLRQGQAKGRWRAVQRAEPPKHASRVWCGHVNVRSWPGSDRRAAVARYLISRPRSVQPSRGHRRPQCQGRPTGVDPCGRSRTVVAGNHADAITEARLSTLQMRPERHIRSAAIQHRWIGAQSFSGSRRAGRVMRRGTIACRSRARIRMHNRRRRARR